MDKIVSVSIAVVPVLVSLLIGYFLKLRKIISQEGIHSIKTLIMNITLPAVLFNAYLLIDYNVNAAIVFIVLFAACGFALSVGHFIIKITRYKKEYFPYLLSTFEVGMLGYALYSLLFGAENINNIAIVDLGQVTFVFTLYMSILNSNNGQGGVKAAIWNMLKSPVFLAIFVGVLLGVTGMNIKINNSGFGQIITKTIEFIAAPTSATIMIVVGYEFSLSKKTLKGAMVASAARLLVMALTCALVLGLFSLLMPLESNFMWAVILVFSLPPVYVLPMFVKDSNENEYISTSISIYTLVTVALFIAMALFIA